MKEERKRERVAGRQERINLRTLLVNCNDFLPCFTYHSVMAASLMASSGDATYLILIRAKSAILIIYLSTMTCAYD